MAYIKFSIVAVETSLKDQCIYVHFNKEVDTDTIDIMNFTVAAQESTAASLPLTELSVSDDLKTVIISFKDTPLVNTRYIIVVQNTVKDLEGHLLEQSLFRELYFKSTVTSTIQLLAPANFEVITTKIFSWKEMGDAPVNCYRLQISTDTAFNNVQINNLVTQSSITLGKELSKGQYYYRVRAEQDNNFGSWSEIRTFLIQESSDSNSEETVTSDTQTEDTTTVVIEDLVKDVKDDTLHMIGYPKNGETGTAFDFVFEEDLDVTDIKVSIMRSDL